MTKLNQYDNRDEVFAANEALLTKEIVDFIAACRKGPQSQSQLINVMHKVQAEYGYLSPEHLDAISQLLQVPAAKVTGVATFYHFFRLQPRGKFVINVCLGTACYVQGAERIAEKMKEELGIDFGETTKDSLFSLEASRCLGTCALAPVVMVNDRVHGDMTPDKVAALLEEYTKAARDENSEA